MGFLGGSVLKKPPANLGDVGSIPGLGRSSGEGNGDPLQCTCLGNPVDRGPRAHKETQRNNNKHDIYKRVVKDREFLYIFHSVFLMLTSYMTHFLLPCSSCYYQEQQETDSQN